MLYGQITLTLPMVTLYSYIFMINNEVNLQNNITRNSIFTSSLFQVIVILQFIMMKY